MGKTKSLLLHLSLAASCTFSWQAKSILGQVEMQLEIHWMGKPAIRFTFCISVHQSWPNMCVFNHSWDTLNEMFLKLSMSTDIIYAWNPAFTLSPRVLSKNVLVGSAEPGSCDSCLWWSHTLTVSFRAPSSKHQILAAIPRTSRASDFQKVLTLSSIYWGWTTHSWALKTPAGLWCLHTSDCPLGFGNLFLEAPFGDSYSPKTARRHIIAFPTTVTLNRLKKTSSVFFFF